MSYTLYDNTKERFISNRILIFYCPGCKSQLTETQGEQFMRDSTYNCEICTARYITTLVKVIKNV